MCAYIYIHVRQIHMWVCIYLHICPRACKCVHTCLFLYMCVWVYIHSLYVCERTLWVHTDAVCAYTNIYISGFVRVCVCVYIYTYMYEKSLCVHTKCVHTNTYMSVLVSCLQLSFICVYRCMYICTRERHHGWTQLHCGRIDIHVHVSVFVRGCVCMSV